MPNAPKTPTRTFRCSDELWEALKVKAAEYNLTATDVLIGSIQQFLDA